MSQTKIMDFCGSGDLMRAILTDHHTHDALVKGNANKKFYVLIFAEDDKPECPPIMPGDQMAYNNGNGWDYVTFGCIERGPINKVPAESVCPDLKTTLQGNDLSVQFDEERMDVIGQNGNDGLIYKPQFGPPLWAGKAACNYQFSSERGDDEESQV